MFHGLDIILECGCQQQLMASIDAAEETYLYLSELSFFSFYHLIIFNTLPVFNIQSLKLSTDYSLTLIQYVKENDIYFEQILHHF